MQWFLAAVGLLAVQGRVVPATLQNARWYCAGGEVRYSPSGRFLMFAGEWASGDNLSLWECATGKCLWLAEQRFGSSNYDCYILGFSNDERNVWIDGSDGYAYRLSTATGEVSEKVEVSPDLAKNKGGDYWPPKSPAKLNTAAFFDPSREQLIYRGSRSLYDDKTRVSKSLPFLSANIHPSAAALIAPDTWIAIANSGEAANHSSCDLWFMDPDNLRLTRIVHAPGAVLENLCVDGDSSLIAVSESNWQLATTNRWREHLGVRVYSTRTWKPVAWISGDFVPVRFTPSGKELILQTRNSFIASQVGDWGKQRVLMQDLPATSGFDISPNGKEIAFCLSSVHRQSVYVRRVGFQQVYASTKQTALEPKEVEK